MTGCTVDFTRDAAVFLDAAGEHLAADALPHTVLLGVAGHEARRAAREPGGPVPDEVRWFATVRDAVGAVVGVAMRTAPFAPRPVYVGPMPDDAALALADALGVRDEHPGGVNGSLPAARLVGDRCAARWGVVAVVDEHLRLHELGELWLPPAPPGGLRPAGEGDAGLCLRWFRAFEAAAAQQAGREPSHAGEHWTPAEVGARIEESRIWLWERPDGEVVHLTGGGPPEAGVARIGPVYTPPAHRGRGYAGRAVAEVSALLRAGGARVTLFTDQANPTSNALYARIGYRPVADMANHLLLPAPAEAAPERSGS